jgi:hypothetical protein
MGVREAMHIATMQSSGTLDEIILEFYQYLMSLHNITLHFTITHQLSFLSLSIVK